MSEEKNGRRGGDDLYRTLAKVLYLAVGLGLLIWFSHLIRDVILAGILALILAIALNAPVAYLEGRNISRGLGTVISFFAVVLIFGFVGWLAVPRLVEEIPNLVEQVPDLIETLVGYIMGILGDAPAVEQQLDRVVDWVVGLFDEVWRYTDVLLGAVALGIFVLALALYMVVYLRPMLAWYVESMPVQSRDKATRAFANASRMVLGWVYATVILGGIKATAVFVFLTAVGVDGPVIWSLVAFLGAFVPQVGFYVMTIPPVLMIFAEDPLLALWTFVYYAVFSELLGRFVAPWIYAETMRLSPVYVLFMVLAVGYAFGLVGVLIATPIAGFLKAYYDEFYLAEQPDVERSDTRVEVMVERNSDWAGEAEA